MSEDKKIYDLYSRCGTERKIRELGHKPLGNVYWFRNTNFRYNMTFVEDYRKFKSNAGVKRSQWPKNSRTTQNIYS